MITAQEVAALITPAQRFRRRGKYVLKATPEQKAAYMREYRKRNRERIAETQRIRRAEQKNAKSR